jgi:hypothetical protein
MYPPQEDSRRRVQGGTSLWRYRSAGHQTFVGENGSIRIETLDEEIILDRPGVDGRKTHNLNTGTEDEGAK